MENAQTDTEEVFHNFTSGPTQVILPNEVYWKP